MNFSHRSNEKELLDRNDIPFKDIRQNMDELDFINTWLGGHKITIDGLQHILSLKNDLKTGELLICEIGCGGGDNLLAINEWCSKRNINPKFIGIDINPDCIEVASQKCIKLSIHLIASDYLTADLGDHSPDIIFSSLFCHHFSDEALVTMLLWMGKHAGTGYFINDLHRHRLAYYSIKWLTRVFSRSYLVKHDAPLSVLRGFKSLEWHHLLQAAGIKDYLIQWKWAFRYLITVKKPVLQGQIFARHNHE